MGFPNKHFHVEVGRHLQKNAQQGHVNIQVQEKNDLFLTMVQNSKVAKSRSVPHSCCKPPILIFLSSFSWAAKQSSITFRKNSASKRAFFSCGASRLSGTGRKIYLGQLGNTVRMAVGFSRESFSGMSITFPVFSSLHEMVRAKFDARKCFSHSWNERMTV